MMSKEEYIKLTHVLEEMYGYLCDGRVYLAREKLEQLLGIDPEE